MRTRAALIALPLAASLAGCVPANTAIAPPTAAAAPKPPARLRYPCFEGEQLGGLLFRVTQIASSSTLQSDGDGNCQADRRIVLTGNVVDPTGSLAFRVTRFNLDRMTDQDGRDLLAAGNCELYPRDGRGGTLHRPSTHPGNTATEGFSAQIGALSALPTELSELRGRVFAEVPGEIQEVVIGLDSAALTEPVPGLKVRIRRYREDRGYVTAQLEYTLDRQSLPQGKAPPIVLSAAILNEERQVVQNDMIPNEFFARNTITGVLPIRAPLTSLKPSALRLQVSVDVREVCYQIEAEHVQLTR